jgi:hypothetical protein
VAAGPIKVISYSDATDQGLECRFLLVDLAELSRALFPGKTQGQGRGQVDAWLGMKSLAVCQGQTRSAECALPGAVQVEMTGIAHLSSVLAKVIAGA